jgi:L,D-peptidoglycan transpeptidase YkuD (ErfK/YbiS/YcfS/YnhG family)
MKKRQIRVILLAVSIMISLCACSGGDGLSVDKDSAQARREEMWKYRDNDKVNQILYVTHTEGSNAIAEFYEKNADEGNAWVMVFRTDAFIGVDQMGQPDEQSGRTPLGDYGIGSAFGIRKNPGTKLEYIDVGPTTYACDEDCEFYNQIIDISKTGHDCKGEEMYKYSPEYNYGLQTGTNPENVYNKGSNLFIHCKGAKPFTMGCVAIDEEYMVTLLQKADPGMRVYYSEMYEK